MKRALVAALMALCLGGAARADDVQDAAGAYAAYRVDLARIGSTQFAEARALDDVLEASARHNAQDLARGWMAYGGLVAAQVPAFAAGLRGMSRATRSATIRALTRDVGAVTRRRGYQDVVARIAALASAERGAGDAAADALVAQAHAAPLATFAWDDAEARAGRLRALARARFASERPERVVLEAERDSGARINQARAQSVRRMAALGALSALGGGNGAAVRALMDDAPTAQCLSMAELQFLQCVSVAHGADEPPHCAARHALRERANCLGALAR